MTTTTRRQCVTILLLSFLIHTQAQDRAQDHNSSRSNKTASRSQDHNSSRSNKSASLAETDDWNSSRSNKTRSQDQQDDWTFGVNSGASFAVRNTESSLFRGNSIATKLFGRYHFGNMGLGFSSGIVPGTINNSALNRFIIERKFQQAQTTRSNPFNSYLLFGPSFRFGNRVVVNADIQGGMFINNPGGVSIGQTGAVRPLYRFEGAGKNLSPGFSGNISVAYPVNNSTRFFINTDYLQSKSSIRLYDPQQGIDVATDQDRQLKLFTVGIGITKSFGSKRDAARGIATGKRNIGNVKYETLSAGEGAVADERIITTQRHAINTKGTGATNGRMMNNGNCGPVTQTITNADGTTEELTFACPDDAAMYNERISMNVTVPKQTQGATFGEKVNAGLHAAGSALSQGASRGVISGTVSWGTNNSSGIITNQDAVSSVGNLAGGGGGAAAASYAATGRMTPSTNGQGITTTIYTREAGSGMATGKRSARDHNSGMATGRRQYQPVFHEGETNECTGCAVSVKLIGHELAHTVQQGQKQNNPLYNGNGNSGTNPLSESKLNTGGNNNCNGVEGLTVLLINPNNGAVAATTKTTSCGDFFFANVPDASYVVKVTGGFSQTKNYDVTVNSDGKMDMAGEISTASDHWSIQLNTGNNNMQKAGISTSRSNIRCRSITVVETDMDGNGEFELTKCIMEFSDGSTKDVTENSRINSSGSIKKVTVRGWDPEKKQERAAASNSVKEYTLNIDADKVSHHPNVVQWIIAVDDTDADMATAAVIKTKTKSNQSNDRIANVYGSGSNSYIKNLPVFMGDIDNDGITEILTGNSFDAVENSDKSRGASLLGGALPGGAVISAFAMPGTPIGGIIVKGGKNPGGSFRTTQTNQHGEFEFTNLEKGSYIISAAINYYINDEMLVTVASEENDNEGINPSTNKSAAQDHNSSRSNKSSSIAVDSPGDNTSARAIVNTTKSNTKDFLLTLDELDQLLNADKKASASAIRTTKENSRVLRSSVNQLENNLQNAGLLERSSNAVDTDFAVLLGSVNKLGQQYNTISNTLKARHDVAMNSIRNMK